MNIGIEKGSDSIKSLREYYRPYEYMGKEKILYI
jgi:hypothetical protein